MKKPLRSSARGASFHTKHASNANVVRGVLLDAKSYLAYSTKYDRVVTSVSCGVRVKIKKIAHLSSMNVVKGD
jgi:hypothetical protein